MNERFIMPDCDDCDVTLIDTVTGEEYTDNFEDIVAKMNELAEELAIRESREIVLKEHHFSGMKGFSYDWDGRGRYAIMSHNVIPMGSVVVEIKSPSVPWNKAVKDLIWNIIGDGDGDE